MVVAFVLAGVPVFRLTRPATTHAAVDQTTASVPATPAATPTPAPLDVEAIFAPPPTDFQVTNLGQTILAGRGPQARFQARWTTTVPPEGVDLVIEAHWPTPPPDAPPTNAAARISVRFADGRQVDQSVWANADGTLKQVFTVPGVPGVPGVSTP